MKPDVNHAAALQENFSAIGWAGTARIAIIESNRNAWAESVYRALCECEGERYYLCSAGGFREQAGHDTSNPHCLYIPGFADRDNISPDLNQAETSFQELTQLKSGMVVLISSALVYGTGPGRQAFATEEYRGTGNGDTRVSDRWRSLEEIARGSLNHNVRFAILRPAIVLPSPTFFGEMIRRKLVTALPGHDPVFQFLSLEDLARAIHLVFTHAKPGVFNVAPDEVTPLRAAIRIAGGHRVAVPRTVQRLARHSGVLDYLRYSWTISNQKIKSELGFSPAKSSTRSLQAMKSGVAESFGPLPKFDDFGMDKDYIHFFGKTLFRFLHDYYWRIENKGLEHVPREGRGVLVGVHRGFMPWDGVMALQLLVQKTGRYPRFLTHPALLKFPFLFNFMTKLGGVIASQQSADRLLQDDGLVGIFPEGIQGAFSKYRDTYQLKEFGRDAYVKIALRNRAPIVPFVTIGSAEIFPILGKIKSRLLTRYTDWPCLPITPTFPLLPIPLPSKWHTQFLPAIHVERQYPPEAAQNKAAVKAIGCHIRAQMQQAIDEMLRRRRSIFFGSIFEAENI